MKHHRIFWFIYSFLLLSCVMFLPGCSIASVNQKAQKDTVILVNADQIPNEYSAIIQNNLFSNVTVSNGKLLKADKGRASLFRHTTDFDVKMMDPYGRVLSTYAMRADDAYDIHSMMATDDGGFLFVLGFTEYARGQGWAGDKGFSSRIIKCSQEGAVEFDTPLESVTGEALRFCFEVDGCYYLFGTLEAPETKKEGVYSSTDVFPQWLTPMDN